jgi:hypothetical protein
MNERLFSYPDPEVSVEGSFSEEQDWDYIFWQMKTDSIL